MNGFKFVEDKVSNIWRNIANLIFDEFPKVLFKIVIEKSPPFFIYQSMDRPALFQATSYAPTFALPDSTGHTRTLSELYINKRKPTSGTFHPNVNSPSGDPTETNALAIDQLQPLRNTFCHSSHSSIDKAEFDNYAQLAKDAFTAVNVSTSLLEVIGNLAETDFPTADVQKLNERTKDERSAFNQFLENEIKVVLNLCMDEVNEGIVVVLDSIERMGKFDDELGNHSELRSKLDEMNEITKSNFSGLGKKIDELTLNQETEVSVRLLR